MNMTSWAALAAATLLSAIAIQPLSAQPFDRGAPPGRFDNRFDRFDERRLEEAYRDGYRSGYSDGRRNLRYDDRYNGPPPLANDDREQRWQQRYSRTYTYNDDAFYQECRQSVDPAGVIAGALVGGLFGNVVGRGSGGATFAGVILGGAAGAALTRNLECEDRSYAYKTYYDGFNAGRPNADYQWRNPRNGHRGDFRVGDYYNDPDGFRCATYSQQIFVNGQSQTATGRACQQPDGSWAIIG